MPDLTATLRAFLASQSTMALATVAEDGRPEVAPIYFVSDDVLDLYWLSAPGTRHAANLAARPRVAAAVYPAVWAWSDIRGAQIEGEASVVADGETRERALALYRRKFTLPAMFDPLIAASTLYVLRPAWMRWLDNGIAFGHKAVWTQPDSDEMEEAR